MTPAERATLLRVVDPPREVERTPPGGWRFRLACHGKELQIRNVSTPTLRLDLLRTEAHDLMFTLAMALDAPTGGLVRATMWQRFTDWLARSTWRRKHEVELRYAVKQLAQEFNERNGW